MWWEVAPRRSLAMGRPYLNAFLGGGEGEGEWERAWDGIVKRWFNDIGRGDLRAFFGWRALSLPWWVRGLVYDVGEENLGGGISP